MNATPTDNDRLRHAVDLRAHAALVREHGWELYRESWSRAEILGVEALLDEAAADAACPQWAPTLWGTAEAEADAHRGYSRTRRWFTAAASPLPSQLTDEEQTRWDAATSALSDLAAGLADGEDAEAVGAALSAARQAGRSLDMAKVRDSLHIPEGAGEYEEGLVQILLRIPDGWGRWLSLGRGWYRIVVELDRELAAIDSGYELHQVKEKFGGLRVYFHTEHGDLRDKMNVAVDQAEARAAATCELCGEHGLLHTTPHGWVRTLCPSCAAQQDRGYTPVPTKETR